MPNNDLFVIITLNRTDERIDFTWHNPGVSFSWLLSEARPHYFVPHEFCIIHIYTIYSLYLSKPYDLFSLSTRNCLFQESFFRMSLVYAQLPSSNKIYIRVTGKCRSNKAYFSEYIWQICDKKICKRLFLYYYNKRSRLNSEPSEGSVSANYKYRELFSTVSEEEFMCSFLFVKKKA